MTNSSLHDNAIAQLVAASWHLSLWLSQTLPHLFHTPLLLPTQCHQPSSSSLSLSNRNHIIVFVYSSSRHGLGYLPKYHLLPTASLMILEKGFSNTLDGVGGPLLPTPCHRPSYSNCCPFIIFVFIPCMPSSKSHPLPPPRGIQFYIYPHPSSRQPHIPHSTLCHHDAPLVVFTLPSLAMRLDLQIQAPIISPLSSEKSGP